MRVLLNMMGGWGNQLFQYAHAKALSEFLRADLHTHDWVGRRVFDLRDRDYPKVEHPSDEKLYGYYQNQESLIYSKSWLQRVMQIRPEVLEKLDRIQYPSVVAHRRLGDYVKLGFPVVSEKSYLDAADKAGVKIERFVTEDNPILVDGLDRELSFLPDFYCLMKAKILFRGNSTFSWWAGALGKAKVYSPVIENTHGGENDVPFVEGNHPRMLTLDFLTDLHLNP